MIDDEGLSRATYRLLYYLMVVFSVCILFAFWWLRIEYQARAMEVKRCAQSSTSPTGSPRNK